MRVTIRGLYFDNAFTDLEDRDIESTATEVEYGDRLVFLLIETVSQRGRRRLVDDTQDFKPSDLARVFRRLTLSVIKICRNRNDGPLNLRPEIILGRLL